MENKVVLHGCEIDSVVSQNKEVGLDRKGARHQG